VIKGKNPLCWHKKTNLFRFLLLVLLTLTPYVAVSENSVSDAKNQYLSSLISQLSTANFTQKLAIVDDIEKINSEPTKPILEAFLAGELFYLKKETTKVVHAIRPSKDSYQVLDVYTNKELDILGKKAFKDLYKKVRVNNRLRKKIKLSISKISLVSGSDDSKVDALNALMSGIDFESATLVASLYEKETSSRVRELMSVVIAVHELNEARRRNVFDVEDIGDALLRLDGRLEVPVKTALVNYKEYLEQSSEEATGGSKESTGLLLAKTEAAIKNIDGKIEFYEFSETLFFGLSLGSVLLLAAIGLAITFGVMGVINMAHGEMIMLGAYTTYVVQLIMPNLIEYSLFVAIPAAFFVSALVGILIQRTVIRYLHGRPLETLLATFGISLILRQAVRTIFSPLNRQVDQPMWMSGALELNPVLSLTYNRLYILIFSLMVFIALVFVIKKTSLGLNVRAVSQNRAMAKAMGVKTEWVDAMTFGLGSGVAGVAGVALSQLTNVGPNLGQAYIVDSFMVVVFGGVGNLIGTLVASFSLGIANKFMEPITGAVLANIFVLVFIILFIQKRPKGLFPQKGRAAE